MDPLQRRELLETIGAAALSALGWRTGPLSPPSGPISPTGASLEQILSLLQAGPSYRTVAFHSSVSGDLTEVGFAGGHEVRAASISIPGGQSGIYNPGIFLTLNKGPGMLSFITAINGVNPIVGDLTLKYYRRENPAQSWTQYFEVTAPSMTAWLLSGCQVMPVGTPTNVALHPVAPGIPEVDVFWFEGISCTYRAMPSNMTKTFKFRGN